MKTRVLLGAVLLVVSVSFFAASAAVRMCPSNSDLPAWAVPHGEEFWKQPGSAGGLDDAVSRIRHAIRETPHHGFVRIRTPSYSAEFGAWDTAFLSGSPPDGTNAGALLRTRRIQWGNAPAGDAARAETAAIGNVFQALLNTTPPSIEHWEAGPEGLQLTWVFREALAADGDLVVEVEIEGLRHAGTSPHGIHFAGRDGVERVRFGEAVAVDSTRRQWVLAACAQNDGVVITVPAAVLAEVVPPFCIDPAISPEFGMDNVIRAYAPANFLQSRPAAAWGATNGLIVWQDLRRGNYAEMSEVYGTRISPEGDLMDPVGIRVAAQSSENHAPGVAWDGSDFIVTWTDGRSETSWDIYAAAVSPSGELGESVKIDSATNNANQWSPAVASDGTNRSLIVWTDYRNSSYDIYGRLVTTNAQPLGAADFRICGATNHQEYPAAAWGGTNYLVSWTDRRHKTAWNEGNIFAARISPAGTVLDTNGIRLYPASGANGSQDDSSVAWGGSSNYLVTWADSRSPTSSWNIFAARIAGSGQILDPASILVCGATNNQSQTSVSWGRTNYFVTWIDYRGTSPHPSVYGARLDGTTNLLDPGGIAVSTNSQRGCWNPCAAWNGSMWLAAWQDDRVDFDEADVYGTRIRESGQVSDPSGILLSRSADNEVDQEAAWGRTNYLVVWRDNFDELTSDIYGARIGDTGTMLDPNGIAICTASNKQRDPKVCWGGTNWFVVWEDDRNTNFSFPDYGGVLAYQDVFGTRVSDGGQVLDPNGIGICTNPGPQFEPVCAWNGTSSYLVAWTDYRENTNPPPSDIYGTRVSAGGQVLDGVLGLPISTNARSQFDQQIAWGGTNYLVVWIDRRANQNYYDIYGTRLSGSGQLLDPNGIAISTYPTNQGAPQVAWGGTNFLVLWEDRRDASDENNLYASRISSAGGVLDPAGIPVCTATGHQFDATLGWSGTNWLAVWNDWRVDLRYLLFGTRIDSAGTVLDGAADGFELFTNRASRYDAVVAPRSNGLFFVTYSTLRYDGLNSLRIMGSFLDVSPLRLVVNSEYGAGSPATGTNSFVHGLPISCLMSGTPQEFGDTQFVCYGWTGNGSVPSSGTGTSTPSFNMDQDSTIHWLWTTNFRLVVTIGGVGSANWTNGWVGGGSNATITALEGAHYYFNGWQGDVPSGSTNNNPLTISMPWARYIGPEFSPYLTSNGVPHWWLADHQQPTNAAATYLDPDDDELLTWQEWVALTDPTNRASRFARLGRGVSDIALLITGTDTGRLYDVYWAESLPGEAESWTPFGLNLPGTGGNLMVTLTNMNGNAAMYRFSVRTR